MKPNLFLYQLLKDNQYNRLFNLVTDLTVRTSTGNIIYITDYTLYFNDDNTSQFVWVGYGVYNDSGDVYATSYTGMDKDIEIVEVVRYTRNKDLAWVGYFKDVIKWLWLTRKVSDETEPKAFRIYYNAVALLKNGEYATVRPIEDDRYLLPYYYGIRYTGYILNDDKQYYWNKYGRCVNVDNMCNKDVLPYLDRNEDYTSLRNRFDYYGDGIDIERIVL